MATDSIMMKHVAPALGVLVACMLFASPLKAVKGVRQTRQLGSLNPLPYVAMWANCVAWLVYAFLTRDPYVLASNVPGVLIASYMAISCYGIAEDKIRNTMLLGILAFTSLLVSAGITISFFHLDKSSMISVWGTVTVVILIIFYTAPLSVLAEVFATRSSASLYLPFAIMNMVNGLLWSAYGVAVPDAFIYGPNLVGAIFGGLQVILCIVYPSRSVDRAKAATPSREDSETGMLYDGESLRS